MIQRILALASISFILILSFSFIFPEKEGEIYSNPHSGMKSPHNIGELPNAYNDLFAGSGACVLCHNSMTNNQGESISIISDWRSSMMGNAAKDPFWQAKVSHETAVNPQLKDEIETVCSRCHAPMGNLNAIHNGQEHYTLEEMREDPIAMDGVSCTLCHQIPESEFGNYSANFEIGTDKIIYGPYETPFGGPMINNTGYTPTHSNHIKDSRLCGSCHTLITSSLDLQGVPTGEQFVEQAIYHEWLNSSYPENETSCQTCHIPEIDDVVKISSMPPWLEGRTPFGMHHLAGANVFMLRMLKDNLITLGIDATETQMDSTIARAQRLLQNSSIIMEALEQSRTADTLFLDVSMTNIAGHKFPGGYPSRRAYIELIVTNDLNDTIFHTGETDANYNLINEDEGYEPHYNVINSEEQVQIYEMVMGNVELQPTTVLERAYTHLKDNRFPPIGFTNEHYSYDTIQIVGSAFSDPDFNKNGALQGSGADILHFHIPINGISENLNVAIKLYYQTVTDKWLSQMFEYSTDEIDLFEEMYNAADKTPVKVAENNLVSLATGIETNDFSSLSIYPNPGNGAYFITADFPFDAVEITNSTGQLIQLISNDNPEQQMAVSLFNKTDPGLYFVTLKYKMRPLLTKKIIYID